MSSSAELGLEQPAFDISEPEAQSNPEFGKAERIREAARNLRFELLPTNFERIRLALDEKIPKPIQKLGSAALNYSPGIIGAVKMTHEAFVGETYAGQKLTPLGRINHGLIHGVNVLAYYEFFVKKAYLKGGALYAASWGLNELQYNPEVMESLKALALKKNLTGVAAKLDKIDAIYNKLKIRKLFFKPDEQSGTGSKTE